MKIIVFRSGCSYRQRLKRGSPNAASSPSGFSEFGTLEGISDALPRGSGSALLARRSSRRPAATARISLHPLPASAGAVDTVFIQRRGVMCRARLPLFSISHATQPHRFGSAE